MKWMALCLVFVVPYSTQGIDVSMISFCFRSHFISLYEHIFQLFLFFILWFVILWLATYDFAWDWGETHQISPRKHQWTPFSRVYETICFRHSRFFVKLWCTSVELYVWDQLTRNLFEIWIDLCLFFRDLCSDVLLLSHYDVHNCLFRLTF